MKIIKIRENEKKSVQLNFKARFKGFHCDAEKLLKEASPFAIDIFKGNYPEFKEIKFKSTLVKINVSGLNNSKELAIQANLANSRAFGYIYISLDKIKGKSLKHIKAEYIKMVKKAVRNIGVSQTYIGEQIMKLKKAINKPESKIIMNIGENMNEFFFRVGHKFIDDLLAKSGEIRKINRRQTPIRIGFFYYHNNEVNIIASPLNSRDYRFAHTTCYVQKDGDKRKISADEFVDKIKEASRKVRKRRTKTVDV